MSFCSPFIEKTVHLNFQNDWNAKNSQFISKPIVFLCSFPRSGNGWVRNVLTAILLESRNINTENSQMCRKKRKNMPYQSLLIENIYYDVEDIVPDIYAMTPETFEQDKSEEIKQLALDFQVIKTHHMVDTSKSKVIFLFREPLSCLTSASLLLNKNIMKDNPNEINETILYLAKFYHKMLIYYLDQYNVNPQNCFFLSHEKLSRNNILNEYDNLAKFLGISCNHSLIQKVTNKFPLKSGYDKDIVKHILPNTQMIINEMFKNDYQRALSIQ